MRIYPRGGAKRSFSGIFLNSGSPRLASGLPGPPNNFMGKKPTRLGKLIASALSNSSPGRATMTLSALFPINRHAREAKGRGKGPEVKELKERREKKKKEEKMKLKHCRITIVINFYIVLRSFFVRHPVSFLF